MAHFRGRLTGRSKGKSTTVTRLGHTGLVVEACGWLGRVQVELVRRMVSQPDGQLKEEDWCDVTLHTPDVVSRAVHRLYLGPLTRFVPEASWDTNFVLALSAAMDETTNQCRRLPDGRVRLTLTEEQYRVMKDVALMHALNRP